MWKTQIGLVNLVNCSNNFVVSKVLNFRVATKSLKSFRTYYQCQLSLLLEEIRQKKSIIRVLFTEFEFLQSTLQAERTFIDFPLVSSIFLGNNDKV